MDIQEGLQRCDLVPFGMTLIKRRVFDYIDKPYFEINDYYEFIPKTEGALATDQNFCDKLRDKHIAVVGCFDHTLNHREITKDNYMDYRKKDIMNKFKDVKDRVKSDLLERMQLKRKLRLEKENKQEEKK
jgi:hypothetical protein